MISLPYGRKPNQVPYNAASCVCDRRAYLPSQPAVHFAQRVRPPENYFTHSWQVSASLSHALAPPSFGVSAELHRELVHLAQQPLPLTRGAPCPVRVSLLIACGQDVPGSPAHGLCRLHSQLAEFLSVSWNICWITDTGEFHVLSHRKFSGLQSWLQIAPGNNSEYIFASNISMGKDELLHMIWEFFFAEDFVTKLN